MLNASNKKILIIGGSKIAARKARSLLPYCNKIIAISEEFSRDFDGLPVNTIRSIVEDVDLNALIDRDTIVIITTELKHLNRSIEDLCDEKGALYNRVDDRSSPIIFPAISEINGTTVTVSTSGKSPSLAKFLRDLLSREAGKYVIALPVVERLRKDVLISKIDMKGKFFETLFNDRIFWDLITANKPNEAYTQGIEISERLSKKYKSKK